MSKADRAGGPSRPGPLVGKAAMAVGAFEGVMVVDTKQWITAANTRLAAMVGYSVEELTMMSLDELTVAEDVADLQEMIRQPIGIAAQAEHRLRCRNGTTLWTIRATTPYFDEAGSFAGAYLYFLDNTDRKHLAQTIAEQQMLLRSYFEQLSTGIALADLDATITRVNPALSSITGHESEELIGTRFATLIDPNGSLQLDRQVSELVAGNVPSFDVGTQFLTKDERLIWLALSVSLMRDDQGEPIEFVIRVSDISERKEDERIKQEFVSVTSHELRTPLTSVRGALGLLAGGAVGDFPEPAKRMLDIAVQSTDRLIRLINDILDLERLSTGQLSLSIEECEVAGLVSRAVEELRGAADAAAVELHAGPLEGRIWADSDRMIQMLTNLIGNAIKFAPRLSTVEVSAHLVDEQVSLVVLDQGPGIPANQLESVFERFRQVDGSDSRAKGGTGLGLTICREIVEQHGGRIWVESMLGHGSRFCVTLPAVADADAPDQRDGRSRPVVLVCDDDASVRAVVKAMLDAAGYQVWTAANGEEAVALSRSHHPDAIVLDLMMPGIDGRETAVALKSQPETAEIPIVILSVLAADDMVVEGATSWVDKPIEGDALLLALRRSIGKGRRHALIVEDDPQLAEVLAAMLTRHGLEVRRARSGREAVVLSQSLAPDLLVLDLALPEGDGFSIVEWMRGQRLLSSVALLVFGISI